MLQMMQYITESSLVPAGNDVLQVKALDGNLASKFFKIVSFCSGIGFLIDRTQSSFEKQYIRHKSSENLQVCMQLY